MVSGGNECLDERLSFKVKREGSDLLPGKESEFDDGKGNIA